MILSAKERLLVASNFGLREMKEDNGYITPLLMTRSAQPLRSVQNGDFESFGRMPPGLNFTDEIRRSCPKILAEGEFFTGGPAVRAPSTRNATHRGHSPAASTEQYEPGIGIYRAPQEIAISKS